MWKICTFQNTFFLLETSQANHRIENAKTRNPWKSGSRNKVPTRNVIKNKNEVKNTFTFQNHFFLVKTYQTNHRIENATKKTRHPRKSGSRNKIPTRNVRKNKKEVKTHALFKTPFFLLKSSGKSQWIDNHVKTNWFPFGSCSGVPFWGGWSAYLRSSVLQLSYPVETLKRDHSFLNPKTVTGRPAECQAMRFMASKRLQDAFHQRHPHHHHHHFVEMGQILFGLLFCL